MVKKSKIRVLTCDAGGTMTDLFIMDEEGNYATGKAATTPKDESISYWLAIEDAAKQWGIDWKKDANKVLPEAKLAIYSGTAMVNLLLQGIGAKCGLITNKGLEDTLIHERARGPFAGYGYADRLHKVTHKHNEPLIPPSLVRGIRGKINPFGLELVPLNEEEVKQAANELLDRNVEAIAVCFTFCFVNASHEARAREIIREVMQQRGVDIPVYLSTEVCPLMREVSRTISTTIHARITEVGRKALSKIEDKLKTNGYKYPLQIALASGGLANMHYPRLVEIVFCGPIGGLIGAQYISQITGIPNWIATDLGGTSFDV